MNELKLITVIVERGNADRVVKAALEAGASGATVFYARGMGVREKLGLLGRFISPEKEVILMVTKQDLADKILEVVSKSGKLDQPAKGFAFIHSIERAVGFTGGEGK